jgi:hypothetical protein
MVANRGWVDAGLGATTFAPTVSLGQAALAEALGAFTLVTAVFGPLTGASVNLARTSCRPWPT